MGAEVRSRIQSQSSRSPGSTIANPQPFFRPVIFHLCASVCPSANANARRVFMEIMTPEDRIRFKLFPTSLVRLRAVFEIN